MIDMTASDADLLKQLTHVYASEENGLLCHRAASRIRELEAQWQTDAVKGTMIPIPASPSPDVAALVEYYHANEAMQATADNWEAKNADGGLLAGSDLINLIDEFTAAEKRFANARAALAQVKGNEAMTGQTKGLQLKAGAFYVNGTGRVFGPMMVSSGGFCADQDNSYAFWRDDGVGPSPYYNLVAECAEDGQPAIGTHAP